MNYEMTKIGIVSRGFENGSAVNDAECRCVLALVPPDKNGQKSARASFLVEELQALNERGVKIHTVSSHLKRPRKIDGVTVHPIPRTRNLVHTVKAVAAYYRGGHREFLFSKTVAEQIRHARYQLAISRVIRDERIDVVYSPFAWPAGTAGIVAARSVGVPVIVSLRGVDVLAEPSINYGLTLNSNFRSRISRVLSLADQVVGVSRAIAERAIALGAPSDRVSVVLKGVDEVQFSPGDASLTRRRLGLADRPTVLFVGNLNPCKGLSCLLDAYETIRRQQPEVQLVICGRGPEEAKLKARLHAASLDSHVQFVGQIERPKIPDYFRACDVLVLPSLAEGSGNVLLEAAASGKPLVGSNVNGIPDYIDHGETGFLFEKENPTDLAAKLLEILGDRNLAARMGQAARARVEREFRYDQMIDNLLAVFEEVIAAHRTSYGQLK